MTLTDRSDQPRSRSGGDAAEVSQTSETASYRPMLVGAATALGSLLLVVVPSLLLVAAEPRAAGPASDAVPVGAALWLLAGGAHLTADGGVVSVVPLLGLAVLVFVAKAGARRGVAEADLDGPYSVGLVPRGLGVALLGWWVGYAVVTGAAAVIATRGPLVPVAASLLVPTVVVPIIGAALMLARLVRDDPGAAGPALRRRVLPNVLRRAARPGLAGAGLLLGIGLVLVTGTVVAGHGRVMAVHTALDAGTTGSVGLVAAQLSALPNLGLWAVSFVAGPGFQVVDGATVSWAGVEGGLLPMVPVLAALPQPGPLPWVVPLISLLVVVGVGAWVGHRALGTLARLSRMRTKLIAVVAACLAAAGALGVLDLVAGGAVGRFRLAELGPDAATLAGALFVELLAGSVVVVARDAWRLRH
ncbi:MAG: cell division protein PerM [Dermatophilaceae bacterium]